MEEKGIGYGAEQSATLGTPQEMSLETEIIIETAAAELIAPGKEDIRSPKKVGATRHDSSDSVAGSTTDDGETEEEDADEGERKLEMGLAACSRELDRNCPINASPPQCEGVARL